MLTLLALLPLATDIQPRVVEGVVMEQVAVSSNGATLGGYLMRPSGAGRHPAVLCCHGFSGRADDVMEICTALARFGYVAMAVDFRGSGKSPGKPGFARGEVQDALAALAFLRGRDYVDPKRVAAWGAGMGGSVALLAAAGSPDLKAAVGFMAPTDCGAFVSALIKEKSPAADPIVRAIGGTPRQVPEAYRARSPLVAAKKIKAAVLLVYGEKDSAVPPEHGARMRWAMQSSGVPCTVKVYPNEGNAFANPANAADAVLSMLRFLNAQLENTPRPGTLEACLLRRMELMQAVQSRRAAGGAIAAETLQVCDLAEAALQARKYPEAEKLIAEALKALGQASR